MTEETYARKVKILIARTGSQKKLAKALGTTQQQVSRWALGAEPCYFYSEKIDELYNKKRQF